MRVLVTGCHGKIGTAVCDLLASAGDGVVGIDRRGGSHGRWPSMADSLIDAFAIHRAFDFAAREIGTVDGVVHLANHTNVHAATPELVLRENLAVNASVFQASIERGVKRIVFASSVQAVLGGIGRAADDPRAMHPPAFPVNEQTEPRPTNGYGLSKLLSERMLDGLCAARYEEQQRTSAVSLRMPYVLDQGSFEAWSRRGRGGHDYRWGGCECYAYIHQDDIAAAIVAALAAELPTAHEVIWVSAPDPRVAESVAEIAEEHFRGVPGVESAIAADSFVDLSKAARVLGWKPTRLLRDHRADSGVRAG